MDCQYSLTLHTLDIGGSGTVTGTIDWTCGVYIAGSKICHPTGTVEADWVNGSGPTPSRFVWTTSVITVSNGAVGSCPLGNGDKAHLSTLSFNVVPDGAAPFGPIITRTA
jgi:hypothetical protein